jgi:protoheme IX farnesyltransferase
LAYTIALLATTLVPVYLGYLQLLYLAAAILFGLWFLWEVVRSIQLQNPVQDYRVFKNSIVYLSCLFLAMLVDLAIPKLLV